jgi:hypothetical protein
VWKKVSPCTLRWLPRRGKLAFLALFRLLARVYHRVRKNNKVVITTFLWLKAAVFPLDKAAFACYNK